MLHDLLYGWRARHVSVSCNSTYTDTCPFPVLESGLAGGWLRSSFPWIYVCLVYRIFSISRLLTEIRYCIAACSGCKPCTNPPTGPGCTSVDALTLVGSQGPVLLCG